MTDISSTPQPNPTDKKKAREEQQRQLRTYIGYAISALIISWLFQRFFLAPSVQQTSEISYSTFKQSLTTGQIVTVKEKAQTT